MSLEGVGLRSGARARVRLRARPGVLAVSAGGPAVPRSELRVIDAARATTVEASGRPVATIEHLFAACAGLGIHDGLLIEVEGGEVPLLDGAASLFASALGTLGISPSDPLLVVQEAATLVSGESRYTFSPASQRTRPPWLSVTLEYADPRIAPEASWDGTPHDFLSRLATARTFAFAFELEALAHAGHASHAARESVVVLGPGYVHCAGVPFAADEPARHKLLDLLGDLFLYGGPPRGHIHAFRPGHRATHAILREALRTGVVG